MVGEAKPRSTANLAPPKQTTWSHPCDPPLRVAQPRHVPNCTTERGRHRTTSLPTKTQKGMRRALARQLCWYDQIPSVIQPAPVVWASAVTSPPMPLHGLMWMYWKELK